MVQNTIRSIISQDYPLDKIELLVVGPAKIITAKLDEQYPIRLITIDRNTYPSITRNIGAKNAKGDILIFIDDDCEADKDWILHAASEVSNIRIGAVGGRIVGKSRRFFSQCTDFANFYMYQSLHREERASLNTSTLAIRKNLFFELNGFDETLRVGEDVELCARLASLGYKLIYQPDMVVWHNHGKDTLVKMLKHSYFWGENAGLLIEERKIKLGLKSTVRKYLLPRALLTYLPFAGISCLYNTLHAIKINFRDHKYVLLYAPFILLSNISYQLGVLTWLRNKSRVHYV